MPVLCAVFKCGHNATRDKEYRYFRFPKVITSQGEKTQKLTKDRRKKWIANISRADLTDEKLQHTRVCSCHFITGNPASLYDVQNPDWAPTQNMGHNKIKTVNTPATKNRAERAKRRCETRQTATETQINKKPKPDLTHVPDLTESINQESLEHGDEATNAIPDQTLPVDMPEIQEVETSTCTTSQDNFLIGITPQATKQNAECQTDLSVQDIRNMEYFINSSTAEIVDMKKIIIDLEKKVLERTLSQKSFQNNDAKARFYTGLPNFAILLSVFNQLSALDVEETRKIANVRIHVERVIGLVRRKYTILQTILPIEFVSAKQGQTEAPIDKIARVCCALTNLSDSVVPFE